MRLSNGDLFRSLYGSVPELTGVAIRSVNLNPSGPTVTLRVDLPSFPEGFPEGASREWLDAGIDTVQCQLAFLDVREISLTRWDPPTTGDVRMEPYGDERRTRVAVEGSGVELEFECHEFATLSHVSAFKARPDGTDSGPHRYVNKVDARLYQSLPTTEEYTFYGR
ncbi:Imm50 family immunity protein [Streptomyces sp. NPDC050523]|uniref:Imm50 family immunity protein n=1 Tax=Streptomyces sp. NPDC050523 TaxID=3365622 RepID=UPI0037893956